MTRKQAMDAYLKAYELAVTSPFGVKAPDFRDYLALVDDDTPAQSAIERFIERRQNLSRAPKEEVRLLLTLEDLAVLAGIDNAFDDEKYAEWRRGEGL